MNATNAFEALARHRVIPVVRTDTHPNAERAVRLLERAGYTTFEITLTTPHAIDIIRDLAGDARFSVGAGTVTSRAEAEACLEAGARFLVSPYLADELPDVTTGSDVPLLLGGLTPTEIHQAHRLGATAVKIFPAGSMGGPSYIRSLRSVFPNIPLVPTGGVTIENLTGYLDAGAACVGIGSDLINDALLERLDEPEWTERARFYLDLVRLHERPEPTIH